MKKKFVYQVGNNKNVTLRLEESFIYPTDAQIDCSKRMLKFSLKFTF